MKATKKPVVIDYFHYNYNLDELNAWVTGLGDNFHDKFIFEEGPEKLKVKTLEGTSYDVTNNHTIIRGIKGEYYPCVKDIFLETYDTYEP